MVLICYPKCSTCAKAQRWLDDNKIEYSYRDIQKENPGAEELKTILDKSGLPIGRLFNTSGMVYREQNIKEKRANMTEAQQLALLATDGMMVKRPLLLGKSRALVGFKVEEWENALLDGKSETF